MNWKTMLVVLGALVMLAWLFRYESTGRLDVMFDRWQGKLVAADEDGSFH